MMVRLSGEGQVNLNSQSDLDIGGRETCLSPKDMSQLKLSSSETNLHLIVGALNSSSCFVEFDKFLEGFHCNALTGGCEISRYPFSMLKLFHYTHHKFNKT